MLRFLTPPDRRRQTASDGFPCTRRAPGGRLFTLLALCVLCLLAVACKGESDNATPQTSPLLAPADLFSRRAPSPRSNRPLRLLVVGDSLSISLGEQMERALHGAVGIDFTHDGTRSTGLTRPELLNWPAHLRERVSETPPDVVVIMIGANDVMPVEGPDGNRVFFDSPDWNKAYAAKAAELLAICRAANPGVRLYWVGVPAMGESSLAKGVVQVNAALASQCAATPGCRFIETHRVFSDPAGNFSRIGRDAATGDRVTLRTADGVHMTEPGAKLLTGIVLAVVASRENFPPIAGVDELRAYARDVRPVPDPEAAANPEEKPKARPSGKIYTVKKGDTLITIAHRLGLPVKDLVDVNPGLDTTHLSIGQSLSLPVKR